MKFRSACVALLPLLLPVLLAGCGEEQLTLNVRGDFQIVRGSDPAVSLPMEARLYEERMGEQEFDDAWAVITRGAAPYDALALTMISVGTGDGDPVPLLAGLVLSLPTPIRDGARYPIAHTFPPPVNDMPLYWNMSGGRELSEDGTAEIALRAFDYHTVGMRIENEFIATAVEGFAEVLVHGDDYVELRLDLTATDAAGAQVRLWGDMSITAERYTPPIT